MASFAATDDISTRLKPPLKWAGGKRWLVPYLLPIWTGHKNRRIVEPFCGGLAVTLELMPKQALLNDINPHLINFYKWLQKGFSIKIQMKNEKIAYYECREDFNKLLKKGKWATKKSAELFYYLNRTGYNGLCRFNKNGGFNVPFGKHKTINYMVNFFEYKDSLSQWEFSSKDFEKLSVGPEDFLYADPPYDVEFTKYAKEGFSWEDQERLAHWLSHHAGPVVLSNQATDRIVALYEKMGFVLKYLNGPRRISCNGDRSPAKELLAYRNIN